MEQLLLVVNDDSLRIKLYEGLLNTYALLADSILMQPRTKEIDISRKDTMLGYLKEAEIHKNLENYDLIKKTKMLYLMNIYTMIQSNNLKN